MAVPRTPEPRRAVGITVNADHWKLFQLLHDNASGRVRALVLMDLRSNLRKGNLDDVLDQYGDQFPELKDIIARIPR